MKRSILLWIWINTNGNWDDKLIKIGQNFKMKKKLLHNKHYDKKEQDWENHSNISELQSY